MRRDWSDSKRAPEFRELGSQSCCSYLVPAGLEAKLCHRSQLKNRGSRLHGVMIMEDFFAGLVREGYKTQPEFQVCFPDFCVFFWWPWFSLTCTFCCCIRRGCMSKEKCILPFLYTGKKDSTSCSSEEWGPLVLNQSLTCSRSLSLCNFYTPSSHATGSPEPGLMWWSHLEGRQPKCWNRKIFSVIAKPRNTQDTSPFLSLSSKRLPWLSFSSW